MDLLCLSEDKVIAILRFFKWNERQVEAEWFENHGVLSKQIGIEFDTAIQLKNPEVKNSTSQMNQGFCSCCVCEFDESDPEMKAVSLQCGHQFCWFCWTEYLKEKVKSDGP